MSGSINLLKFVGAKKIIADGKKGIFIPVDQNPTIVVGTKGAYAHIRVVEKDVTFDNRHYTHFIAASLSKEKRDDMQSGGMTEEQINAYSPILGNLEAFEPRPSRDDFADARTEDAEDLPF